MFVGIFAESVDIVIVENKIYVDLTSNDFVLFRKVV